MPGVFHGSLMAWLCTLKEFGFFDVKRLEVAMMSYLKLLFFTLIFRDPILFLLLFSRPSPSFMFLYVTTIWNSKSNPSAASKITSRKHKFFCSFGFTLRFKCCAMRTFLPATQQWTTKQNEKPFLMSFFSLGVTSALHCAASEDWCFYSITLN